MAKIYQASLALLVFCSLAVAQQTLMLNDGTQYRGHFAGGTQDTITFVDQNGYNHRFDVDQIQSITFPNRQAYDGRRYRRDGRPYSDSRRSNNLYASLPAGTTVAVRTNESINTRDSQSGRTYAAQIDRDVLDSNGNILIPRGSDAQLIVRDAGNNQVLLDLQSVMVNGRQMFVDTQDLSQSGENNRGLGANRRTGTYVGGGAALGTLLGAIGGGGKGALIGALAGAAAGAGVQVLTRGHEVRVPAETVLNFQLNQPVYLYQ